MRQLEPRSLWRISYRIWLGIPLLTLFHLLVVGQDLSCSMENYRTAEGLQASLQEERLLVTWTGEGESELRVSFGLDSSRPVIRELAIRKGVGEWSVLGHNLLPEFNVTTGLRRISEQQLNPVRDLQRPLSDDLVAREKWNVFWDAPLVVPGIEGINPGLPRRPEEIQRATAVFDTSRCEVATNGARLEITFPGVSMGIFLGSLRFTVYRGTNLFRQEVVAKTEEPSVAYKYSGGLAGFHIDPSSRVIWRDTSRAWQKYEFGGSPNSSPVAFKARNRLAIAETGDGSIAVFPPPHKFFFAREVELNLGFVWYRKDNEKSYSIGIRHGDHEEAFPPYGFSKELWDQRTQQARLFAEANFALYNAPPGTWQRMPVYFYLSPDSGPETQQGVLAYTHNDRYRELPDYKVAISHFHTHFAEQLADLGTLDYQPPWIPAFRALGINIAMMSDFHADGHPKDLGPIRLTEQNNYFEACRRHSDRDFLIIPGEEPNAHFGGHYTMVFPRPVYWTQVRGEGQAFVEEHTVYGKVYHIGSAEDELEMLRREGGLVWQAHPRTKGSTLYPDAIRDTVYFQSDRFLGGAYQSLPVDQSENRICEKRCFGTLDDMNNWTGLKFLLAEGDSYTKYPEYDIYSHLIVNYVKIDSLPSFSQGWDSITRALRDGKFFVTTGEVLFRDFAVEEDGSQSRVIAELEWTFPLEFVEVVWGDGTSTDCQVIPATELPAFGNHRFSIFFDSRGKKWVRFAAWDSAGNGAFVQPVPLNLE